MRLWHQKLIPYLPRQQLLGQHRECCALRGKGWGRKHATVDYVFIYSPNKLVAYHLLVMREMNRRGYNPDRIWTFANYRGKTLGYDDNFADIYGTNLEYGFAISKDWEPPVYTVDSNIIYPMDFFEYIIYPEHNEKYLKECLDNLKSKGIEIELKGE